jgi:asparagine synthase (glutamine-hydrolysing)
MCGVCGVVQIGGEPRRVVAPEVLERMTDAMAHRGPYDRGLYQADGVALGARRLPLVDIERGHQPFGNEDGSVWGALNGMIFNHDELREELRGQGHAFKSVCDTEVIPHLYEQVGDSFPERMRGEFGIGVWDGRRRRALLVRDRVGVKPLYHARVGDLVVFGSELKSVLASGLVEAELDYEAIEAFLTFGYIPGPRTPLRGVEKVPPGHRIVVDADGVRAEAYWRYPAAPDEQGKGGVGDYADGLLEELETAVRLRLMADVPVGAMLSGGLDSSLVVALMARHSGERFKTFSVGFRELGEENELADARLVAETFGTDHHEMELSIGDAVDLEELVWHLDEPLEDLSAVGLLELSKFAATHVTSAQSGMGPDELLGGYMKHQAARYSRFADRLPRAARHAGSRLSERGPRRLRRAGRTFFAEDPAARLVAASGKLPESLRRRLVRGPLAELDGRAAYRAALARLDGAPRDSLDAMLYLDGQLDMVDHMLPYIDRASMARSLDVRAAFLDHHVVEYCARVPSRFKVHGRTTKYVVKHAARGIVPDRAIDKRKTGFFRPAIDAWLKAHLGGAVSDYLLSPSARYAEMLDRREVERLVSEQAGDRGGRNIHLLLSILLLEVWLSSYLPRALGSPVTARERIRLPA